MYAICDTSGCGNFQVPVPLPAEHGTVVCGPCGVPVTRLEENAPAEPKEMPTWEIE